MAPKEKADQLVSRYTKEILKGKYRINGFVIEELAEECALIAVDEMMEVYASALHAMGMHKDIAVLIQSSYLQQVKQEIEKL